MSAGRGDPPADQASTVGSSAKVPPLPAAEPVRQGDMPLWSPPSTGRGLKGQDGVGTGVVVPGATPSHRERRICLLHDQPLSEFHPNQVI